MAHHFHAVVGSTTSRRAFFTSTSTRRPGLWSGTMWRATFTRRRARTGHRIEENKPFFEDVAAAIVEAGALLIVGPAQEKDFFAKFLAVKHPAIRDPRRGIEKADHPTDGELIDFARRYAKGRRPHAALRAGRESADGKEARDGL